MDSENGVFDSTDLPEIDLFDVIEYEENGQLRFAYYIGDGRFILLEKRRRIDIDGATKPQEVTPVDTIDSAKIVEWESLKEITRCKYTVKNVEKMDWRKFDDNIDDIKEHDMIEVKHLAGIRHLALCTGDGHAIDLNPTHSCYVFGNPPLTSFIRGSRTDDPFCVEKSEKPMFANGIIQRRPIREVIGKQEFRVRRDQIEVNVVRNGKKNVYYLEPQSPEKIRMRIKQAEKLGETQYNLCKKNCQHFVTWLKYGVTVSYQAQRLQIDVIKNDTATAE